MSNSTTPEGAAPRAASRPAAGAARTGFAAILAAAAAKAAYAYVLSKTGDPGLAMAAEAVAAAVVGGGLGFLGKWARDLAAGRNFELHLPV